MDEGKEAERSMVCLLYQVKLFLHQNVLKPKYLTQNSLRQSFAYLYAQRWGFVNHIDHRVCVNAIYFSYALEA